MSIDPTKKARMRVRIRLSRKIRNYPIKEKANTSEQAPPGWTLRAFFHDGNWAYHASTLITSVVALIIAFAALFSSFHLTNFSADVSASISLKERENSNDQRCVDSLIDLRGSLSNLSAGYSLRPLDRVSRLHDWDESRQALDAVTLSCGSEVGGDSEVADRYAVLLAAFGDEYLRAPTGEWSNCAAPQLYDFAEFLALDVMDLPGDDSKPSEFEEAESCAK